MMLFGIVFGLLKFKEILNMDNNRTKLYDKQLSEHNLCDCAYCRNYTREIITTYPELTEYLSSLGVAIEKPFETMPLEPDETGYVEYTVLYIICGKTDDFTKTAVGSVTVDIADSYPSTELKEEHFVIEVYPVRLKWIV